MTGQQTSVRDQLAMADTKCVNAHDRCFLGGPCPYCEVTAWRDEKGRFALSPRKGGKG